MEQMNEVRAPGEVVEYYEHPLAREVVEYYVQPRLLPGRKPPKNVKRRSKKGLWIFLICCGLVAVLAAGTMLWQKSQSQPSYGSGSWDEQQETTSDKVTIPTYPTGQGAQMALNTSHGQKLTAQEIYAKVNPAVVTVMAQIPDSVSVGTGVIFSSDGYLLTNYHVVAGGSDCTVVLASGASYAAKYVGGDSNNDIAVLKVDMKDLPVAEIGDSDALTVGDQVYAIGNPLGVELRGTLTDGLVSAINRDVEVQGRTMTLIQTNAALNEGNSGGPLINVYGQVVGINTIKMMSSYSSIEGLGFALPMASVQKMVNDILTTGKVQPEPLIGVSVSQVGTTLEDGTPGTEVFDVTEDSPAGRAGVKKGDIIVSAAGRKITSSQDLLRVRRQFHVGDTMTMRVWRDGSYLDFTLELTDAVS